MRVFTFTHTTDIFGDEGDEIIVTIGTTTYIITNTSAREEL